MKKAVSLVLLLINAIGFGQNNQNQVTEKLQVLYSKSDFPGFSVAIVNKDGVLYKNGFGYADLENKIPYTTSTTQNIGSVSKTFIGVAMVKAIEMGYFDLETPINSILPFKVKNPNIQNGEIKIKHLVSHTSGILDDENVYTKSFILNKFSKNGSPLLREFTKKATLPKREDEELAVFLKNYFDAKGKWYKRTNFNTKKAGEEYNYSNIGASLAAYLIELKSNMPFNQFCKKYIFEPLQMDATEWKLTDSSAVNHAKTYNVKKQFYPLYSEITYPDGALITSTDDLSQYLIEMIKGYNQTSNLLSNESFKLLFKKQFDDANLPENYDKKEPNSGVFWRITSKGDYGHTGSDIGITTFLFFNPKTGIGKLFMTNIELDNPWNSETNDALIKQFKEIWKSMDEYSN